MQRALLGSLLVGLCCGILSPYIVLRRLSLVGEGYAHLAFGGIALAFFLGTPPVLTACAVVVLGSLVMRRLLAKDMYGESAIALILSFGVGLGIILIGASKGFGVDLFSYLIGSILTLSWSDLGLISGLVGLILLFFILFRRELFLLTFQKDVATLASKNTKVADYIFSLLVAFTVILAIQAVGILLVTALVVIPGLISFIWAKSFYNSVFISTIVSVVVAFFGVVSSYAFDITTSGLIVMLLLGVFALSHVLKRLFMFKF